ncbi:hypothetical protein BofuT4_P151110.1 [Botrytis cinerea T4]|uniref:Uncharacterized protein n=1 Tax=Botryotinia fuckeliana (strain T4) TaxID=999810 RepID=G2YWI1_BOTF4|nr:hypothetical protein BofuT4_P151110.1 [Botrytis cinerea T4]
MRDRTSSISIEDTVHTQHTVNWYNIPSNEDLKPVLTGIFVTWPVHCVPRMTMCIPKHSTRLAKETFSGQTEVTLLPGITSHQI